MTQKRGLGRGLGALIPGAGSPAARPSAPSPAPEHGSPAEADGAGLRTRSHPRTAPEPGEAGASSRPVDMFFSGDPAGAAERTGGRAGSGRDVAGAMARAAAERRASGKKPAGKAPGKTASSRGAAASTASTAEKTAPASAAAAEGTAAESTRAESAGTSTGAGATARKAPAKKTPAKKAAAEEAPAKKAPAKTAAGKADAGKTAATKRSPRSTSTTPAGATPEPATAAPETAAPEDVSPEESALESAVEVERVTPTPARSRRPAQADASDLSDHDTAPAGDGTAAPDADVDDAGAVADGAAMDKAGTASAQDADPAFESAEPAAEAAAADDLETPAPEDDAPEDDNPEHGAPEDSDGPATEDSGREDLLPVPGAEFAEIPIHEIRENPRNPRTQFDEDALDELAYSLREVGVLQPIVVRPIPATDTGESFELVMGERRWRAARRAGLATIPAIIRETTDDDLLRDALLENLHRSQLNPLEEAAAYQQLLEDFGCTQDELSERIGRSRPQISNTLRLMKLPPLVQRRLASGALSAGHARALLGLDSPALMEELAQRIVAEGLSVRAVERLVSRGVEPAAATKTPRRTSYDPRVVDYTSRLSTRLEAPVRIDVGKRKGRITLEFTNLEDLERLMDRLGIEEYRSDAAEGSESTSHQE